MASTACYRSYFIVIIITVIIILVISIFNTQCVHVLILRAVFRCACILCMMIPVCASGESCHKYFLGLYLSMIMPCSMNQAYFGSEFRLNFCSCPLNFCSLNLGPLFKNFFCCCSSLFCFSLSLWNRVRLQIPKMKIYLNWICLATCAMYVLRVHGTHLSPGIITVSALTLIPCQVKNVLTCGNPFYSTIQSIINVTV